MKNCVRARRNVGHRSFATRRGLDLGLDPMGEVVREALVFGVRHERREQHANEPCGSEDGARAVFARLRPVE